MALAILILAMASLLFGRDVAAALGAVAVPLAGLGGAAYVGGKVAENKRPEKPT